MTQLFDTDRAEDTRRALHKQSFASYKAYEFLKAGIRKPEERKSEAKQRLEQKDPFNFPELDHTVHAVLSDAVLTP